MPKQTKSPKSQADRDDLNSGQRAGDKTLLQYAGLATQLLVTLGLGVFVGIKVDHWFHLKTPIATWLLPLMLLLGIMIKLVRDTGTGK